MLVGYNPWGCKDSDTTERLTHTHSHTHTHAIGILAWDFLLDCLCINSELEEDQVKCDVQWDANISDKTVPWKLKPQENS